MSIELDNVCKALSGTQRKRLLLGAGEELHACFILIFVLVSFPFVSRS